MIIIIGLVILVAAVAAGVARVLSNSGSGHPLTHPFAVFGYHVTGSTGTLFAPQAATRVESLGRRRRGLRGGAPPRRPALHGARGLRIRFQHD